MKKCPTQDCPEQILNWQVSCYKHKGEKNMEGNNYGNPQPQGVPQQPTTPGQMPERSSPQQPPQTQPTTPQPTVYGGQGKQEDPKKEVKPIIIGEIPELSERERLIVKQVAFKKAVEVIIHSGETGFEHDTLYAELQELTVNFYKIIVAKNEKVKV